jgi:hypothetical protein
MSTTNNQAELSILIAPLGSSTEEIKEKLLAGGIVVIEHENPESFKLLKPCLDMSHSDMLYAAMNAISRGDDSVTKSVFAKTMASIIIKNREEKS